MVYQVLQKDLESEFDPFGAAHSSTSISAGPRNSHCK